MRTLVSIVFLIIFFVSSCSQKVVKRTNKGRRPRMTEPLKSLDVRKKVALLSFFNESPFGGQDLGVTATEELREELSRAGEFIVDGVANRLFGSSKEIYSGGGVKLVQIARKAKLSGINLVIYGRVIDARVKEKSDEIGIVRKLNSFTSSKIEIRVFDVNSNKEVYNQILKGYADDSTYRFFRTNRESKLAYRQDLLRYAVRVAVRRGIQELLDVSAKMDWTGRVAKIIGNKIYVNAGRKSGLNIGDILKVLTEGNEIYDPESGALIGLSKGEIKGTIEVIDFFGPDGSIAIIHSGSSVLEGDFVQLY